MSGGNGIEILSSFNQLQTTCEPTTLEELKAVAILTFGRSKHAHKRRGFCGRSFWWACAYFMGVVPRYMGVVRLGGGNDQSPSRLLHDFQVFQAVSVRFSCFIDNNKTPF